MLNACNQFFYVQLCIQRCRKTWTQTKPSRQVLDGVFLKKNELYMIGGLIYRANDAGIASIGLKKENYIARVSYDVNLSTLTAASTGRGGFEVSFTYMHQNQN